MPEIISTCCGEAAVEESGEWSCSSCDCPCDVEVVTDEPQICPDCHGAGGWFDDGEYDPQTQRMVGGRMRACRTCHGKGVIGNE